MQNTNSIAYRTQDLRSAIQLKLKKADEWSRKPLTGRASIIVPAVIGVITFMLLLTAYMLS